MTTVRIRFTGDDSDASTLKTLLHGLDGIDRVDDLADRAPRLDEYDARYTGLIADLSPDVHLIEIQARDRDAARTVREATDAASDSLSATIEFVEAF